MCWECIKPTYIGLFALTRVSGIIGSSGLIVDNVQSRLGYQLEPTVARRLMSVELSYIAAFFQSIEDGCGSVANYLAQCGFTEHHAAKLRAQFLTSASSEGSVAIIDGG